MKVIDLSAGKRAIWFDKRDPVATFVDIRPEMDPDIVADSRNLPESAGDNYHLVVFDPPHVNFGGSNDIFAARYGQYTSSEIRDIIQRTAKEAHRVTRLEAFMAFKWNDHDQRLDRVLALMAPWWNPLFGHKVASRTLRSSSTYWVLLRRLDESELPTVKGEK